MYYEDPRTLFLKFLKISKLKIDVPSFVLFKARYGKIENIYYNDIL